MKGFQSIHCNQNEVLFLLVVKRPFLKIIYAEPEIISNEQYFDSKTVKTKYPFTTQTKL